LDFSAAVDEPGIFTGPDVEVPVTVMKLSAFAPSRRSGHARTVKQASNCPTIDRWCSPLKPFERGEPVVVSGGRIGAVIEKNLDGLHETRLGSVMQRLGSPAVGPLPREAAVLDTRAVTQERRDVRGVILSSLVAGAREPDPRPRSIDARPRARERASARHGR
jgi:hypothetical protein